MKVLRLKLRQNQASYTQAETVDNHMTYPLPPFSTIIGALHNACGYTEYNPMNISIQGKYDSMQREIYVNHGLLNSMHNDRNILAYLPNPNLLSAGYIKVGEGLKGQGNSFYERKTVRINNEKLYQKYVYLIDLKKDLDQEKKEKITPEVTSLKSKEKELKAKQKGLDKRSDEFMLLKEQITETKAKYKKIESEHKSRVNRGYDQPIAHYRTLVKAPKFQEVLYGVELVIHIQSSKKSIKDIIDNIYNLVCIGRSEDFVELIDIKEVELREPKEQIKLKENYKIYANLDNISTDEDGYKPFFFLDGQNRKDAKGTVYYLNKEYTIIDNKRKFNKIACLYSSSLALDENSENAYIDEDGYLTDFN